MVGYMPNHAFIDGTNLHLATLRLGWTIDYRRFRRYLREKFHVEHAWYFMGYVSTNQSLYTALRAAGFDLIFKPTERQRDGTIKGNCDAELVLKAMVEIPRYEQAVIVTNDGDFACLAEYLRQQRKLCCVLTPELSRCSKFLRSAASGYLRDLSQLQGKLSMHL